MEALSDWLGPLLAPVGVVFAILALIGAVRFSRRRPTRWAVRPIKVEHPTKAEVQTHSDSVERIEDEVAEAGPHVDEPEPTDDEIDAWASGE